MTADPGIGQHFSQKDEVNFGMNSAHLYFFYPFREIWSPKPIYLQTRQMTIDHMVPLSTIYAKRTGKGIPCTPCRINRQQ